ncbi:hypothetical protein [Kitasatospora sp. NPDC059160]|uniref:hypothetical protein n=1 Tax=Kitasatospora sp. NPDC059160 TaxID=3346748 RepID=UPI0036880DA2
MTVRRRWAVQGLRAGALAALLAYAAGRYASRSGGLVEVERLLDRPVPLLGAAVVLLVVSAVLGAGSRVGASSGARAGFVQIAVAGFEALGGEVARGADLLQGDEVLLAADPGRPTVTPR